MASPTTPTPGSSRREFIAASATTAAALAATGLGSTAYAAGSDVIRVGLVGAGGRGSGAATQALQADPNVKLVAVGDAFEDRLTMGLDSIGKVKGLAEKMDVPKDRQFTGFDAYKHVIDSCDVVILATPPHFRPEHLKYAVQQGKHAFVEKPVATDSVGTRDIMATCEEAKKKNLAVVSGLCWRYDAGKRELMKRVHGGEIGDIVAIHTVYNSGGVWDPRARRDQCKSDMEYQMRNWYYYSWLSGDHIVEQAVHAIDKMGWAMKDQPPVKAWAVGGRQVRTGAEYGNIWDHFGVVYEYANGVRGYHHSRHWKGTDGLVTDYILGAKGIAETMALTITSGENKWKYRDKIKNMYQVEHDELFASIRAGKPINNGDYMCKSTLLAIMGRNAAYTGKTVTWEQILNSKESLGPKKYEWSSFDPGPVPVPGVNKLA
jgi:predicted dehydrogenase